MGRQIITQPNGKYCIFSSVVDNVTHYDMTPEEIIEEWTQEFKEEITEKVNKIINGLEGNSKPYYQFTLSYEEMLDRVKTIHGEKECEEIKSLITSNPLL